ncbi:hypothetical protein ZWY2020_033948 [Hordeum vulgare]|nr:hypothetical protein ZWY2020_033948 [Hordeum vulgare]
MLCSTFILHLSFGASSALPLRRTLSMRGEVHNPGDNQSEERLLMQLIRPSLIGIDNSTVKPVLKRVKFTLVGLAVSLTLCILLYANTEKPREHWRTPGGGLSRCTMTLRQFVAFVSVLHLEYLLAEVVDELGQGLLDAGRVGRESGGHLRVHQGMLRGIVSDYTDQSVRGQVGEDASLVDLACEGSGSSA